MTKRHSMKVLIAIPLLLLFIGCTMKKCREINDPTAKVEQEQSSALAANSSAKEKKNEEKTVEVYQYDGTKQCGQGKEIKIEAMAKRLKSISILSQRSQDDGLMRIQMCGAPTGRIHVFQIPEKKLKIAIKRGFREWKGE